MSTTDTHVPQAMTRRRPPLIYIHCTALAVWSLMLPQSSPQFILVAFSMLSLAYLVLYNDRRFTNPVAVFTLFFYPYSTWFVYFALLKGGYRQDILNEILILEYIGLMAFAVSADLASLVVRHIRNKPSNFAGAKQESRLSVNILMIASLALISLALIEAITSGASAKRDLVARGSVFGTIAGFSSVILTCGSILLAASIVRRKGVLALFGHPLLVFAAIAVFCSLIVLGERDFIFRFVFCALVVYFSYRQSMNVGRMLFLLLALCLVLPISQSAKGLLLSGGSFSMDFSLNSIFVGEFISSARNIYMLLYHGVQHSYGFLANDIARGLLPFGGNLHFQSTSNWYNSVYRVEHGFSGESGWGFSLIGEGYLLGGRGGVVIVMALVGAIAQILYHLRERSDFWFAFYVLALATLIYCIRADVANVLSQIFKVGGVSVLAFWVSHTLLQSPKDT